MNTLFMRFVVSVLCVRVVSLASISHSVASISHSASVTTLDVREDFYYTVAIPSFQFAGTTYTTIYIQENGALTFNAFPFGGRSSDYTVANNWISPFGADIGGGVYGNISHETFTSMDTAVIQFVSTAVDNIFTNESFTPTSVFVVTWQSVRLFPSATNTEENTFQAVLTTDGTKSYVLFLYDTLQWTFAVVGISAGNNADIYLVCQSSTYDAKYLTLRSQSHCSEAGILVFRVDQTMWQTEGTCVNVYPPGDCSISTDNAVMNRNQRCAA